MKKTTILNLIFKLKRGEKVPKVVFCESKEYVFTGIRYPFNYLEIGTNKTKIPMDKVLFMKYVDLNKTVYYQEENILDEVEKEYLSNVIKPFRNKVKRIVKATHPFGDFIRVIYKENGTIQGMGFPKLTNENMYKGMELDQEYTLKELGL